MSQHVADINLVSIIMDRGDESNFVACNIKHSEFPNLIGVRKDFAQLREIQKPTLSHDRIPTRKRGFGIGMFLRELVQALPSNDVHVRRATLSQTFLHDQPS